MKCCCSEKHEFYLKAYPDAEKIILTGSFNNWNIGELNMEKTTDGWRLPYVLAQGVYEYKYIVDDSWMIDSANSHTIGLEENTNSVLVVKIMNLLKQIQLLKLLLKFLNLLSLFMEEQARF